MSRTLENTSGREVIKKEAMQSEAMQSQAAWPSFEIDIELVANPDFLKDDDYQDEITGPPMAAVMDVLHILYRPCAYYGKGHHRAHVAFARKSPAGGFQNLGWATINHVRQCYEEISWSLARDAFFTINGISGVGLMPHATPKTPGRWRWRRSARSLIGFPIGRRIKERVHSLNACYVDLDVGRKDGDAFARQSVEAVIRQLKQMIEEEKLPEPSLWTLSGRGLYLFWLLRDERDGDRAPLANAKTLAWYENIQRAIVARLRHLGADKAAIDATRLLRVPGTVHSLTQRPATYTIRGLQRGADAPPSYTLRELTDAFGVNARAKTIQASSLNLTDGSTRKDERKASGTKGNCLLLDDQRSDDQSSADEIRHHDKSEQENTDESQPAPGRVRGVWGHCRPIQAVGSAPKRRNGPRERDRMRAEDLERLERHQGGWKKGSRKYHLWLYAGFKRGAGVAPDGVLHALGKMAARCRPPYPSDANDTPLKAIVEGIYKEPLATPGNLKLCARLAITPELARKLELRTIVPIEVTQERKPPHGGNRAQTRQQRRAAIKVHVAKYGLQSSRVIARALRDQGFAVSDWTVNKDLNELGIRRAKPPQ